MDRKPNKGISSAVQSHGHDESLAPVESLEELCVIVSNNNKQHTFAFYNQKCGAKI